jgi:PAS domain S-box-containing protein
MNCRFSLYALPLLLAAAASTTFAWYTLRRRQPAEALTFGLMMLSLSWWSLCYALHICGADLQTQYLFNRLKYIGVIAVPALWLVLALQYTRHPALNRRNIVFIFLPMALFLPIVLTDHLTHLWWPEIWLAEFRGQPVMLSTHGLPYYAHTVISYLYIALGAWFYIRVYWRSGQIYRSQAGLMITAAVIPLVANMVTQLGLSPVPWGLDSFFFTLGGALLALAIFRYRFLDIVPVARRAVVDQIPEGVIVVDAGGRIVDANQAARSLLHSEEQRLAGQPLLGAIRIPELRQALLEMTKRGMEQCNQRDVYLGQGNGARAISVDMTPLSLAKKEPIGQIILLRDITERVAAQLELETLYHQTEVERERLALTIRTATDAIALLDADGYVLASNPSAQQILKAERSDQFPIALQAMLQQAQSSSGVTKTEIDLGQQSFYVTAAPTPDTGLVLTMHDVTHFRQLARLKDEFVRTVSHDLRTPLTSIQGFAQLALLPATPDQKRQNALHRIEVSARRMTTLVSDLLDLATLEAGVEVEAKPVKLGELARAAIEDLEGAALAKGLAIHCDLDPIPVLEADPRLITQVWRNLIDNAIKYTEKGSITIRLKPADNRVLGQVVDTGIGIPPTDLPYLFDKFFRAKHPFIQGTKGTGLGLALVKTIIEKYDGQIWVESAVGAGTSFTFVLPHQTGLVRAEVGSKVPAVQA